MIALIISEYNAVADEFGTFCHRAADDGSGCGREHGLEHEERKHVRIGCGRLCNKQVNRSNEPVAFAKHQRITDDPVNNCAD